jgi:hypothetical protein
MREKMKKENIVLLSLCVFFLSETNILWSTFAFVSKRLEKEHKRKINIMQSAF